MIEATQKGHAPAAGPVAVVTGAADGIGWAIAQRLAQDVQHVVITDLQVDLANDRAALLGADHVAYRCDVTDESSVCHLMDQIFGRYGRLDIVVNNAGIGDQPGATVDQKVDAFDRVLDVHLRGAFLVSREAVRRLTAFELACSIVNISSITGFGGHPGRNAYGAAKAGIAAMTAAMASEWARGSIRVNAIAPGYVMTDLVKRLADAGAIDLNAIRHRTPLGRLAAAEEIAEAVAFLASSRASYITGVTLPVDGGWLAFGATESKLPPLPKE